MDDAIVDSEKVTEEIPFKMVKMIGTAHNVGVKPTNNRYRQRSVSRKYEMNEEGGKIVKTRNSIKLEKKIRLLLRSLRNIRSKHSL